MEPTFKHVDDPLAPSQPTARVVVSTLQDPDRWLKHPIVEMESAHIQNCLRMLFRSPLATLHGVAVKHERDAWDSAGSDFGWDPEPMPARVAKLLEGARQRRAADEILASYDEGKVGDMFDTVPTTEQLEREATKWIRKQPTTKALWRELQARILDGRVTIARFPTTNPEHTLTPSRDW